MGAHLTRLLFRLDAAGLLLAAAMIPGISNGAEPMAVSPPRTIGKIERLDPQLDEVVAADAKIEVLARGFVWSEGPVWFGEGGCLLFSDIPRNTVFQWKDGAGLSPFLMPSGYTGTGPRAGKSAGTAQPAIGAAPPVDEQGSNGLAIDEQGRLTLCQHGDRRVARIEEPLSPGKKPEAKFVTVADRWEGKRFNSPNDLALHSSGAIYFTDPPYGLMKGGDPTAKEIDFNGVYRVGPDGEVTLATREMTNPNGIALSADEKTLYVGQSDGKAPLWRAFDVQADGSLSKGRVVFDATPLAQAGAKGSADGFKIDRRGNLIATGPGGVLVITPEGKHLGTISTGQLISNCAFGDDGSTLYMTSHMLLCRVKLKVKGVGF